MPAPIILQDTSGLARGITGAGSALAQALQFRAQAKTRTQEQERLEAKNQQYGSILDQTLGTLEEGASPLQVTQALTAAVNQGVPVDTARNYGTLYATLEKSRKEGPPGPDQIAGMANLFGKFGMEEDVAQRNADLWGRLTTGGQTEFAKMLVDQIARNQFKPVEERADFSAVTPEGTFAVREEVGPALPQEETFKWPMVDVFEDRTPKERATLKSDLLKLNNVEIKEINKKLQTSRGNLMRYEQLERLNDSKKLPEGLENANINWTTGEIRFPKFANAETQQYVKTVMDFMSTAKDSFGARVTNFEVGLFLKRLPTLANTEEGRRVILKQMQAIEKLNVLHEQSIREVYDHYGTQKIDRASAERIAEDYRADEQKSLLKEFAESMHAQETHEARSLAPEGKVPAKGPDGKIVYIWTHQADKAAKKGYNVL